MLHTRILLLHAHKCRLPGCLISVHVNHTSWFNTFDKHRRLVPYSTVHLSHHCYQLIFILFNPNFRLRQLIFPLYFPHTLYFVHKFQYFFQPFRQPNFFAHLENLAHMLSSSLSNIFQVTINRSTSIIEESFNLFRTKTQFLNNTKMIELPFDFSM